ncbi:low affinity iron permease family protein [Sinorhizobium medicae]|uniref:Low affinity iron permease family protein n=1 Tax=Sinorhizobium medicae TaxID=110321 RepID=A0A6G1WWI1_9HYPH|nr:low affinity iron permease family protein [Sinorhizobium medicae]MQW73965.1 low affinity iron permease family protein [Sinorhizobium medicae]MQX83351.1 low affinity iron permease family protein [Sinorhizobium medicae]
MPKANGFSRFASAVAEYAGRPAVFVLALALIGAWAVTGPIFGFSQTWQLVVNTGTTIVTFLMVFVLQNTQNRDGRALQAKLDELILTSSAENRYVGIEKLDEKELKRLAEILRKHAHDQDDDELREKVSSATERRGLGRANRNQNTRQPFA